MYPKLKESAMSQNFVSPQFCKQLFDQGLFFAVNFYWIVKEDTLQLVTKEFDPDGYYESGAFLIEEVNPIKGILPAYTIKDIEKLVPDYDLHQRNGFYILYPEKSFSSIRKRLLISVEDVRMPDAFAKLLIECIENNIVSLDKANEVLIHAA